MILFYMPYSETRYIKGSTQVEPFLLPGRSELFTTFLKLQVQFSQMVS